jgi:lysophospholipase L1-like esterase
MAVAVTALALSVFLIALSPPSPRASGADTTTTSLASAPPVAGFYLDLGGSASLGFQPNGVPHHNGHRTNEGYANDVKALEAKSVTLTLLQLGCPGETVRSMLGLVKNTCYQLPVTQLSRAIQALTTDGDEPGLVTIDLGFNNIRPCILRAEVVQTCVNQGVTQVRQYLPRILKDLEGAAGPNVHFVGLEYADPFLGYYLNGPTGPALATQTLTAMNLMNATLNQVYTAANIAVANVPGAYKSDNNSPQSLANVGTIPQNVDTACVWTWMCTPPPFGPDDHPNNAGYTVIAQTIIATLPTKW